MRKVKSKNCKVKWKGQGEKVKSLTGEKFCVSCVIAENSFGKLRSFPRKNVQCAFFSNKPKYKGLFCISVKRCRNS